MFERFFKKEKHLLNGVDGGGRGGWWPWVVKDPFAGAWQQNIEWKRADVLCYHAVFACISLIAGDISKLSINRVKKGSDNIWMSVGLANAAVVEAPNSYQNRIQFYESWLNSKLIRGNAYIFKVRGEKGIEEMHVLHPDRVLPLVSDDGQVFYQLSADNLSGIVETGITVPASEIIHDRFNCFYHPLVGLSPLFASGLPAYMGMKALENGSKHFKNGSRPSGILTVPEAITKDRAQELSEMWESKYGGDNYGKVAILGGDLKYAPLSMTAEESQMVEMLKMTAEMVCSTFHVPPYKIGVGTMPNYNNVQSLNLEYYNSALHRLIEDIELCLDKGLDLKENDGIEFDLDGLLRMDSATQIETLKNGVSAAIFSPNEARLRLNMKPVKGGESPMIQQQNYSLEALNKRDSKDDPFATGVKTDPIPAPVPVEEPTDEQKSLAFWDAFTKGLENVTA